MPAPSFDVYENDSDVLGGGTLINEENPISFGMVPKGTITVPVDEAKTPIHIWNDQSGEQGSDTATNIKITLVAADNNNDHPFFNGTELNNFEPMFEARSTDALNAVADAQSAWTPVSPSAMLSIGDMPSNSRRSIELRLNVPIDAPNAASKEFLVSINFS